MVSIVTPTLGNRPQFLKLCKRYVDRQTVQCEHVIVDDAQEVFPTDLTWRYKKGFERATGEVIIVMEDDDWYHQMYVEWMVARWKANGKPDIFGIADSHYYHVGENLYWHSQHPGRSSMCALLIRKDAKIDFPADSEIWLDLHVCKKLKGVFEVPPFPLVVGIKHGIGQCGGVGHKKNFSLYQKNNNFLRNAIGADIQLYSEIINQSKNVNITYTR